jgi:hypothetical protein
MVLTIPRFSGSRLCDTPTSEPVGVPIDPLEFWALLSSQGTILVASASVRDVLGWGTSEVIGRNICAMARDSRSGMRERVEAELAKLDALEVCLFLFQFLSWSFREFTSCLGVCRWGTWSTLHH